MKQIRLTSDPLNNVKGLSKGWPHNSYHFKFARSTMEAGFRLEQGKSRSDIKSTILLLISAFVISFITAGVAIYGV
jgi:hypothetical protein